MRPHTIRMFMLALGVLAFACLPVEVRAAQAVPSEHHHTSSESSCGNSCVTLGQRGGKTLRVSVKRDNEPQRFWPSIPTIHSFAESLTIQLLRLKNDIAILRPPDLSSIGLLRV